MSKYLHTRNELDEAYKKYSQTPANRRLKYVAAGFITAAIILLGVSAFYLDSLSWEVLCIIRGCAGLCAIAFVVLIAILLYRTNSAFWQERTTTARK